MNSVLCPILIELHSTVGLRASGGEAQRVQRPANRSRAEGETISEGPGCMAQLAQRRGA